MYVFIPLHIHGVKGILLQYRKDLGRWNKVCQKYLRKKDALQVESTVTFTVIQCCCAAGGHKTSHEMESDRETNKKRELWHSFATGSFKSLPWGPSIPAVINIHYFDLETRLVYHDNFFFFQLDSIFRGMEFHLGELMVCRGENWNPSTQIS